MRRSIPLRGSRALSLLSIMIASGAGFLLVEDAASGACSGFLSGCYNSNQVPNGCGGAICAGATGYPQPTPGGCLVLPLCDDDSPFDLWTATSAPSWNNCTTVSCSTYGNCIDSCQTCANVFIYKGTCDVAGRCTKATQTIQACGAGSGVSCSTPCPK